MKKHKKIVIGMMIVLLSGVAGYVTFHREGKMTGIPALSKRSGSTGGSFEFLNAEKAVAYYREEIQKKPDVVKNYVELAQLFLQESRVTGNHHEYIPKAQYLIEEALRRDPQNFEANITHASVLMTLHQFREARRIAEVEIQRHPYSAVSYGVLCDALVELGEYQDAMKACDNMLNLRPDLRSYSRASYMRELHGDINGAAEAMKLASDAGMYGQENRAWALYNLGKLFLNEGKLDTAEFIFNGILQERPDYGFALSGLAQVRRSQGRTQDAADLLGKAYQTTPEHLFVEQLADVYSASGQTQSAGGVVNIVLQMFEQHEKDGWNVNREYAMFCANHDINLREALERIKKEYDLRPQNIDVLETYAWILYKNGKPSEAVQYIERAMQLNTQNPLLHYHAGMIYAAAGIQEKASFYFGLSNNENPYVKTFLADEADKAISHGRTVASLQ